MIGVVEIDELLVAMDRAAANLSKLESIWQRAEPFIPTGPTSASEPEYDDLRRSWKDLLRGLPRIDGWTITDDLPDIEALGQAFIEYWEVGEPATAPAAAGEKPAKELAEYRFRLARARRRGTRQRLEELMGLIDLTLPQLLVEIPRDSSDPVVGAGVETITHTISEIERLMGDTAARRGRWNDLHRHLWFGQGHDWHDIQEFDWPTVRADVEAATFTETDPLPVPDLDLGVAAGGDLTGTVSTSLAWDRVDDAGFERMLFDLLRQFPEHHNVQLLMNTNAPDRGRDLSLERLISTSTGTVRTERCIVQAKHWRTKSVAAPDVNSALAMVKTWQPRVHILIIATSGRFTDSAVTLAEQNNETGNAPVIELWPDSKLEALLAQKPHIAAANGLR